MVDGHILFCSGVHGKSTGVAVLVHERHCGDKIEFIDRSDRIMAIDLTINSSKMRVIAAYLPHDGFGEEARDHTFEDLDEIIYEGRHRRRKISCRRFSMRSR